MPCNSMGSTHCSTMYRQQSAGRSGLQDMGVSTAATMGLHTAVAAVPQPGTPLYCVRPGSCSLPHLLLGTEADIIHVSASIWCTAHLCFQVFLTEPLDGHGALAGISPGAVAAFQLLPGRLALPVLLPGGLTRFQTASTAPCAPAGTAALCTCRRGAGNSYHSHTPCRHP